MKHLRPIAISVLVAGSVAVGAPRPHAAAYAVQALTGAAPVTTGQPLRELPVLRNMSHQPHTVEVDVTIKQQPVQLLPGPPTLMNVFADTSPGGPGVGTFPGPALQVTEGDNVVFHIHNQLIQPTTTHFHGLPIPVEQDGAPMNLTPPAQSHNYRWVTPVGFPMFSWYHAHPHGFTHIQVARGMEAPMIILPKVDPLKAFPVSTVFLSDHKLTANNQLPPDSDFDRVAGREGNVITVNGQVLPKLTLRPGEIRHLRIGNFAPARYFDLAIPGLPFLQVGTDGGYLERPVIRPTILLSSAERAEVLIQAPREAGKQFTLFSLPHDRGFGLEPRVNIPLMTIVTAGTPVTPPPVPAVLRHIERINTAGAHQRTFELGFPTFSVGVHHFSINGRLYPPLRIDNVATQLGTEVYTIRNKTGNWDHPMHLHSIQFQILDIDGKPPVEGLAWKDTVNVPRSGVARFAVRYLGFKGHYMFHCHILQHENDGLMTTVFVANAPPFQLPPAGNPLDLRVSRQLAAWCGPAAPPEPEAAPVDRVAEALPGLAHWPRL
jgi:FtsP/CotA-like multicopper oxidase with cupredoxin domain